MSLVQNQNDSAVSQTKQPIPRNFIRGAKMTWHQRRRHKAVLRLLRGLKGKVLDYGCGYGDLTFAISKTNEVEGVDLDPDRVAFATKEYQPIPFHVCEPYSSPYQPASFDIITTVVVLNFVEDAPRFLRTLNQLLRPNGHLLIVCKNVPVVGNRIRKLLGFNPVKSKLWMRSRQEVRDLLSSEGFTIIGNGCFYDPPFANRKNLADIAVSSIEQVLSLFKIQETSGYFLYLARKI